MKPADYTLNVIKFGYRVEFITYPEIVYLSNQHGRALFCVEVAITELLNKEFI